MDYKSKSLKYKLKYEKLLQEGGKLQDISTYKYIILIILFILNEKGFLPKLQRQVEILFQEYCKQEKNEDNPKQFENSKLFSNLFRPSAPNGLNTLVNREVDPENKARMFINSLNLEAFKKRYDEMLVKIKPEVFDYYYNQIENFLEKSSILQEDYENLRKKIAIEKALLDEANAILKAQQEAHKKATKEEADQKNNEDIKDQEEIDDEEIERKIVKGKWSRNVWRKKNFVLDDRKFISVNHKIKDYEKLEPGFIISTLVDLDDYYVKHNGDVKKILNKLGQDLYKFIINFIEPDNKSSVCCINQSGKKIKLSFVISLYTYTDFLNQNFKDKLNRAVVKFIKLPLQDKIYDIIINVIDYSLLEFCNSEDLYFNKTSLYDQDLKKQIKRPYSEDEYREKEKNYNKQNPDTEFNNDPKKNPSLLISNPDEISELNQNNNREIIEIRDDTQEGGVGKGKGKGKWNNKKSSGKRKIEFTKKDENIRKQLNEISEKIDSITNLKNFISLFRSLQDIPLNQFLNRSNLIRFRKIYKNLFKKLNKLLNLYIETNDSDFSSILSDVLIIYRIKQPLSERYLFPGYRDERKKILDTFNTLLEKMKQLVSNQNDQEKIRVLNDETKSENDKAKEAEPESQPESEPESEDESEPEQDPKQEVKYNEIKNKLRGKVKTHYKRTQKHPKDHKPIFPYGNIKNQVLYSTDMLQLIENYIIGKDWNKQPVYPYIYFQDFNEGKRIIDTNLTNISTTSKLESSPKSTTLTTLNNKKTFWYPTDLQVVYNDGHDPDRAHNETSNQCFWISLSQWFKYNYDPNGNYPENTYNQFNTVSKLKKIIKVIIVSNSIKGRITDMPDDMHDTVLLNDYGQPTILKKAVDLFLKKLKIGLRIHNFMPESNKLGIGECNELGFTDPECENKPYFTGYRTRAPYNKGASMDKTILLALYGSPTTGYHFQLVRYYEEGEFIYVNNSIPTNDVIQSRGEYYNKEDKIVTWDNLSQVSKEEIMLQEVILTDISNKKKGGSSLPTTKESATDSSQKIHILNYLFEELKEIKPLIIVGGCRDENLQENAQRRHNSIPAIINIETEDLENGNEETSLKIEELPYPEICKDIIDALTILKYKNKYGKCYNPHIKEEEESPYQTRDKEINIKNIQNSTSVKLFNELIEIDRNYKDNLKNVPLNSYDRDNKTFKLLPYAPENNTMIDGLMILNNEEDNNIIFGPGDSENLILFHSITNYKKREEEMGIYRKIDYYIEYNKLCIDTDLSNKYIDWLCNLKNNRLYLPDKNNILFGSSTIHKLFFARGWPPGKSINTFNFSLSSISYELNKQNLIDEDNNDFNKSWNNNYYNINSDLLQNYYNVELKDTIKNLVKNTDYFNDIYLGLLNNERRDFIKTLKDNFGINISIDLQELEPYDLKIKIIEEYVEKNLVKYFEDIYPRDENHQADLLDFSKWKFYDENDEIDIIKTELFYYIRELLRVNRYIHNIFDASNLLKNIEILEYDVVEWIDIVTKIVLMKILCDKKYDYDGIHLKLKNHMENVN